MALGDPQMDPEIEAQLYGLLPPSLADLGPAYGGMDQFPAPPPPDDEEQLRLGLAPPSHVSPLAGAQYLPAPPPPDAAPPEATLAVPGGEAPAGIAAPAQIQALPSALPQFPPPPDAAPGLAAPPGSTPAPGLPDALSGVDTTKPLGEFAPQYAAQQTPEQHFAQTVKQYKDDPYSIPDIAEQQRYLNFLATYDPVKAQDLEMKHEYARRDAQAAARAKAERENYDRERANLKDRADARDKIQKQTDQIMAEAQRISETKIDPSGGISTGQRIAGVLASIVGGLVQGRTGSARNAGLDAFNDTINRGIEAQKADLANRRGALEFKRSALGEAYARTGDMFVAEESVRQASYQHAINLIDSDAQNWDARGTQAMARAKTRAQLVAAQGKSLQDATYKRQEEDIKVREQARKEAETLSNIRKANAEASKARAEAGAAKKQDQVWDPKQLGVLNPGSPIPPIPMSQADYGKWLGTQKQGEEYKTAARANDPAERARELAVPGVVDDQNQPVLFAGKEEATNVKVARGRASNLVRKIDELGQIIREHGYETDFGKSKAWQQAQQIYSSILLEAKEQDHLGALSGSDIKLEAGKIGTDDPTQVRDTLPGIEAFRHDVIEQMNAIQQTTAVVPQGRTLRRWEPPPVDTAVHQASPEQIHLERLQSAPNESRDEAIAKEVIRRRGGLSPDEAARFSDLPPVSVIESNETPVTLSPEQQSVYDYVSRHHDKGAAVWQQQEIAQLGSVAAGPADDPGAKSARETLQVLAESGQTGKLRSLAKSALEASGRRIDEPTSTRVR